MTTRADTSNEPPNPTPPQPLLVGVDDAADLLGIGRTTLATLTRSGELPSATIGRRRLYRVADLASFAERAVREGRG